MYTRFSGEDGRSPARWLRTLKYELPFGFPPGAWLECVDGLLDGKAAHWADEQPAVRRIMSDVVLKSANSHHVDLFKALLIGRFTPGVQNLEGVNHLVENLRQDFKEDLLHYFQRAYDLLLALGGRDYIAPDVLSVNERPTLTRVISRFLDGLSNPDLKLDVAPESVSLHQAYETVREAELLLQRKI